MNNREYHAAEGVSNSLMSYLSKSAAHAKAYLDGKLKLSTAALDFGSAFHAAVLEPAVFASEYAVFEGDRRTKEGKAAYEELSRRGVSIISAADSDAISAMAAAVKRHPIASKLLVGGQAEAPFFWKDEQTGVTCKCKADYVRPDRVLVDLKTTEDASPEGFRRSVATYNYHRQAAHYLAGADCDLFIFIAVEKKPPYAVAVYELDPVAIEVGHMLRRECIDLYARCMETGEWPGYVQELVTLDLPGWAMPKGDGEEDISIEYV